MMRLKSDPHHLGRVPVTTAGRRSYAASTRCSRRTRGARDCSSRLLDRRERGGRRARAESKSATRFAAGPAGAQPRGAARARERPVSLKPTCRRREHRVRRALIGRAAGAAAVLGSYDERRGRKLRLAVQEPASPLRASAFRSGPRPLGGCGAVRREDFAAVAGRPPPRTVAGPRSKTRLG